MRFIVFVIVLLFTNAVSAEEVHHWSDARQVKNKIKDAIVEVGKDNYKNLDTDKLIDDYELELRKLQKEDHFKYEILLEYPTAKDAPKVVTHVNILYTNDYGEMRYDFTTTFFEKDVGFFSYTGDTAPSSVDDYYNFLTLGDN